MSRGARPSDALSPPGTRVVPLAGGYSGETFLVSTPQDQAVLRLYARRPERAVVDLALLERVRGLVPVPAVLEAMTVGAPGEPPFLLMEALPGDRLDLVLPAADGELRHRLGEAVAGVLVLLATVRFARWGQFVDGRLEPVPFAGPAASPSAWLEAHLDRPWFAGLASAERRALRDVAAVADDLAARATHVGLVHSDFNPKNLLVDPATGGVTGVLDWEFACAGSPLADVGNLLRFDPDPEFAAAVVQSYGTFAPGLPDKWLPVARALDLIALVDLATRVVENRVVAGARRLLVETARTRDLAAGRPDPG